MKKNKKNKTLLTVLILLLAITIGYAAIATTLKINGSADVKSARWNVYWDENSIAVTEGSVETSQGNGARVTDAGKTQIEYSVELSEPGDFYEFTVDAVNEGSLNAKIAPNGVKNNVYESDGTTPKNLPDYLGYTVKYAENDADVTAGDVLEAKKGNTPTRKKYKVRVWYKTDIDPSTLNESTTETLKLVFEVDYVQGDKVQPQNPVRIISGTKGNLQLGDIVGIGETEDFYVISSDNSANGKTVLLSKYNLLVGNIVENSTIVGTMTPENTPGYGLQSIEADGTYYCYNCKGTVPFSSTNYWMDGNNLKSPYNENNTIYYSGEDGIFKYVANDEIAFPYVYDSNSNAYQYISGENGYVNKLKTMGAPSTITGRLMTEEEASEAASASILYENHTDSWFGFPDNNYDVMGVYSGGGFTQINYANNLYYGVRPVIEINTSDIG